MKAKENKASEQAYKPKGIMAAIALLIAVFMKLALMELTNVPKIVKFSLIHLTEHPALQENTQVIGLFLQKM